MWSSKGGRPNACGSNCSKDGRRLQEQSAYACLSVVDGMATTAMPALHAACVEPPVVPIAAARSRVVAPRMSWHLPFTAPMLSHTKPGRRVSEDAPYMVHEPRVTELLVVQHLNSSHGVLDHQAIPRTLVQHACSFEKHLWIWLALFDFIATDYRIKALPYVGMVGELGGTAGTGRARSQAHWNAMRSQVL